MKITKNIAIHLKIVYNIVEGSLFTDLLLKIVIFKEKHRH